MTRPSARTWSSIAQRRSDEAAILHVEDVAEPVRRSFRRATSGGSSPRSRLSREHVAQEVARGCAATRSGPSPASARRPRTARKAEAASGRSSRPPLACGFDPIRRSPSRCERAQLRHEPPGLVELRRRLVAAQPLFERRELIRIRRERRRAAPDVTGTFPRSACRSISAGPVQPFGVRSTISGHRGRSMHAVVAVRASWIARIRSWLSSSAAASRLVHVRADRCRRRCGPRSPRPRATTAGRARASGPARSGRRSCSRSDGGSAAPRRRAPGSGSCTLFHEPASGAVSASPSPTTAATIRSGLSNAAPNACDSTYPSSPPS